MATVAKAAPQPIPRIAPREDLNPYRIAQIQFDLAAEYLKLDQGCARFCARPSACWKCPSRRRWTTDRSKCSPAIACSTTSRAARPRAASAIIPPSRWTK